MKPIQFDGANCVYGKDQEEYNPLPAQKNEDGTVVTCWQLEPGDLERIKETGRVWLSMMTFSQPLQPVLMSVENPAL